MRLRHSLALFLFVLCFAAQASAQSGLRETFGDGEPGTVGGLVNRPELQRQVVDQTLFPQARCNDNSPAIFYYRPASRKEDADKWLIFLKGGGSCGSGLSCSERWFSYNQAFGAKNMTSVGMPPGTKGEGVLDNKEPTNPFAGYNHVFIHYCSSDVWSGTVENKVLVGVDFGMLAGDQGLPCAKPYTINFLGRRIFDAVVATLRQEQNMPALVYDIDGKGKRNMPDLDKATHVVLAGGSAGGGGVINNLDHLRALIPAEAKLVGLPDSSFRPPKDNMDLSQTRLCVNKGHCTVETQNKWDYEEGPFHVWGAAGGTDSSCLLYHSADPYQCADSRHVLTDHVTTPYFVRMDLLDPGAIEDYTRDNIFIAGTPDPDPSTPEHEPLSEQEFLEASRAGILDLASVRRTAHERAAIHVTPGAFAPACGEHDELRTTEGVYGTAVFLRKTRVPMFSVFNAWASGLRPAILAAESTEDSICPRD
jgi:hypothetical protein